VIPLSYVIEWLIYLVLSLVSFNGNRPPPQPPQSSDIDNLLQRVLTETFPPEVLVALKAAGAALLVAVALLLVARGLARWRPSSADADATNEERDSLLRAGEVWARLLAWLRRLLRRDAEVPAQVEAEAGSTAAPLQAVEGVRELYARLLQRGEDAGARRAAATTPLEHETALRRALTPPAAVVELTDAYVRVRYAEQSVDEAEAADLADELEGVQPTPAIE
jgi:Domain of unknown function (DUF4129)